MAIITTDSKNYTDIAAAIRSKNGLATQYKPSEMAAAISAIVAGGGTDNLDMSWVVSSRTTVNNQYAVFTEWKTVIPDFDKVFCVILAREDDLVICTKENIQNRTIDTSTQNIFIPGQMYNMYQSAFQTWDIVKYSTGLRFKATGGVKLMQNNSELSPRSKECYIIIQERS